MKDQEPNNDGWVGKARAQVAIADALSEDVNTVKSNGVLRVKVETRPNMPQFGWFVGLLLDERGDTQAVIRLDHYGLMLKAVHPSKVTPVTAEEEEAYKP